jgi:sialate O-acetylesterase
MQNKKDQLGVLIDTGAQDWQIFQRNKDNTATISLSGHWLAGAPFSKAVVVVRLVRQADGEAVSRSLQWVRAKTIRAKTNSAGKTGKSGSWNVSLADIPAGGLYRIETALQLDGGPVEWGQRGDMVHHLGVGDIWVITGQSNSEGHGKSPAPDAPELGVHLFHARGQWSLATHPLGDSTQTRYTPNRLGSNPSHSPWLVFAKTLKAQLGVPIGLIPASLGGSPLSAWTRGVDGVLFDNMLRYAADAGCSSNAGPAVRGVVWYQGESDASAEGLKVYGPRFKKFVADLRTSFGDKSLPVITTQLNRWVGEPNAASDAGWEGMRQLQRHLAGTMKHIYLLSTLDLGLSDGIHTNSLGNIAIGQRAASVALGGVYCHDVKFRHPDCVAALKKSAKRIELHFDHVDERLHFESMVPDEFPFAVRDAQGDVPIESWAIPKPDRFEIRLARSLSGPAIVVGAPTTFPPSVLPQDISGHRPMLAFTQKIE